MCISLLIDNMWEAELLSTFKIKLKTFLYEKSYNE